MGTCATNLQNTCWSTSDPIYGDIPRYKWHMYWSTSLSYLRSTLRNNQGSNFEAIGSQTLRHVDSQTLTLIDGQTPRYI